ncbi:MAG: ribulose-phosphate 3-epimerase [Deltaproteobacteria bacterium]|nr:ribulose-phosphate 3-epimerase [Deltaproteobacteria bacterium]
MKKIAPSILSADFTRLGEEIIAVEKAGADYIHIDIMDGHFVPNISVGPMIVEAVKRVTDLPLDVHLMITNPDDFIDEFAEAGAAILTFHAETAFHINRTIQHIRDRGMRPGISLNPATTLNVLDYVLADIDLVLLMTVNPGFGGQKFIQGSIPKIKGLRDIVEKGGYDIEIEVDGGIGPDTVNLVSSAGANVFVAGSAIFSSPDYSKTISLMRERIQD